MICPKCDQDFLDVCVCGYQPKSLVVVKKPLNWIIFTCATNGCDTAIRTRTGEQSLHPICKWCLNGTSHAMQGRPSVDDRRRIA